MDKPKGPKSLSDTLREGNYRASLEALRDALAEGMEEASPNVRPQYAARLQGVLAALEALPEPEGSAVDELAARRAERRASSDAGVRAKRRRRTERRT